VCDEGARTFPIILSGKQGNHFSLPRMICCFLNPVRLASNPVMIHLRGILRL
jgi:hypothetical protein